MKKYVLAKEVPFCEVGAEVRFNKDRDAFEAYSDRFKGWVVFCGAWGQDNLIKEGWTKEVKPREFYVRVSKNIPISICEDLEPLKDFSNEIIKVREVLE